jgi:hypothetical protein
MSESTTTDDDVPGQHVRRPVRLGNFTCPRYPFTRPADLDARSPLRYPIRHAGLARGQPCARDTVPA